MCIIYMYIYIHIYIYTYYIFTEYWLNIHTHTHTTKISIETAIYVYVYIHIYTCIHIYIYTYIHMHIHAHTYTQRNHHWNSRPTSARARDAIQHTLACALAEDFAIRISRLTEYDVHVELTQVCIIVIVSYMCWIVVLRPKRVYMYNRM